MASMIGIAKEDRSCLARIETIDSQRSSQGETDNDLLDVYENQGNLRLDLNPLILLHSCAALDACDRP